MPGKIENILSEISGIPRITGRASKTKTGIKALPVLGDIHIFTVSLFSEGVRTIKAFSYRCFSVLTFEHLHH